MAIQYYTTDRKTYQKGILYSFTSNKTHQGTEQIQNADVHIFKPILKRQH